MATYPCEANIRCKAFPGEGVQVNRVRVDGPDDISVWDCVARCYTSCHCIQPRQARRIVARVLRCGFPVGNMPEFRRRRRVVLNISQRQAMFNRSGLTPPKYIMLDAGQSIDEGRRS
jgi:hypothetical protein